MKKTTRIVSGTVFIMLIVAILLFINFFLGNPISRSLADKSAKTYIEETYPEMEFDKSFYNFKDGMYCVFIKSPISIDTHFEIGISRMGEICWDSYEYDVLSKWNTYIRVDREYRSMLVSTFDSNDFFYESNMYFGGLTIKEKDSSEEFGPVYGLNIEELEIDKIYDLKELGRISGNIELRIEDEEINTKRASEILLNIKDIFDKKDVLFYTIDFSLEKPRTEEEKTFKDRESFDVREFLYSDLYEEGLIKRLEKAAKDLEEYYKMEDLKYQMAQ